LLEKVAVSTFLVWMGMTCAPAVRAQGNALCSQLDSHIRQEQKLIASETAQGFGDNSAPRETSRQLRISNSWAAISVAMLNMQANRCPALGRDVSDVAYLIPAMNCATDRMRASPSSRPESCNLENWQPAGPPSGADKTH
jgi:hypothetical protein